MPRRHVHHASELSLVTEPDIVTIIEFKSKVLEPQRCRIPWHHAQTAGHPKMDD
jgi:hypothetical protein